MNSVVNDGSTGDMSPVTDNHFVLVTMSDGRAVVVPPLASGRSVLAPVIVVKVAVDQVLGSILPFVILLWLRMRLLHTGATDMATKAPVCLRTTALDVRDLAGSGTIVDPRTLDVFCVNLRIRIPCDSTFGSASEVVPGLEV